MKHTTIWTERLSALLSPLASPLTACSLILSSTLAVTLPVMIVAGSVIPSASAFAETTALSEITSTIDRIVAAVQELPGPENTAARREKLREIINPKFDFEDMARSSIGAFWKDATPAQQDEFIKVFSNLLARTYLNKIETVKPGMVKIENEEPQSTRADGIARTLVKTTVTNKGDVFPIHYRLLKEDGTWKVYDVMIENIGLVANYRNQFAGIIRKEKFDGLLERLHKQAEK